ncbi:MAG: nuclear transport factor 2 family protein [Alphaproteobacteria bacterium]|nr:MAG: nuclear transport factor 2 family protein [Alphaproteobacteria bacterium]
MQSSTALEFGVFRIGLRSARRMVRRYVAFLNARDLDGIAGLLHERCCLVDRYGDRIEGREAVIRATERFFELEPHFYLRIDALVEHEGDIMLRGQAIATRPEFQADAMWRVSFEHGLISCWASFGPHASARLAQLLGDKRQR